MTDFICEDYPKHKSWFYQKHLPATLTLNKLRRLDPKVQLPQYYTYVKPSSPIYDAVKGLKNQLELDKN